MSSSSASLTPDLSLIGELLDEIETHPPAIEARKLLIQQYMIFEWFDAARDIARYLLKLEPDDKDAEAVLSRKNPSNSASGESATKSESKPVKPVPSKTSSNQDSRDLINGYESLQDRAGRLQQDLCRLRSLLTEGGDNTAFDKLHLDLAALTCGRFSSAVRPKQPGSVKKTATAIEKQESNALDIAITDLQEMARWFRSRNDTLTHDPDALREALVKRTHALVASLPQRLQLFANTALMHIEHEVLHRDYENDVTMIGGEPIVSISRANFLVTQDGYAWDMKELVGAIRSGGGIMRNPLSKQMFTLEDVRAVVRHPLGQSLAALQLEQSKLSQGVRPKTVDRLNLLSKILLEDMSTDQLSSRHAVDEFLAYIATLPEAEQEAIEKLRVPARDSHTGLQYDSTIGGAVRDVQGNRVCSHKTGDFLGQAAHHLRQS